MNILKKARYLAENPSLPLQYWRLRSLLRKLDRTGVQRWLFQCDFEGHFSYLKPYWIEAAKHEGIDIFFFVGNTGQQSTVRFLVDHGVSPDRIIDNYGLVRLTDWDLYASPTEWGNIFPRNGSATRVQLFHTLADKGLEYGGELTKFDVIVANGPIHHEFLDKYVFSPFPGSREKVTVLDTGYAKIDALFDGTYDVASVRRGLGIEEGDDRPLVLYAPNWEASSALGTYGEAVFDAMADCPDLLFAVKLHYMSLLPPGESAAPGDVNWREVLDRHSQQENIKVSYGQDINPYLVAADLMLTDYGGASLEFLAMNRPIVYFDCPGFFDERGHHIFEKDARRTGYLIDKVADMPGALRLALQDDPEIAGIRRDFSQRLLYNPGRAAEIGCRQFYEHVQRRNGITTGAHPGNSDQLPSLTTVS